MKRYDISIEDAYDLVRHDNALLLSRARMATAKRLEADQETESDQDIKKWLRKLHSGIIQFRTDSFKQIDSQLGIIGSALLGVLIGVGHEGNSAVLSPQIAVTRFLPQEIDTLREYALFNAIPFLAFFALQLVALCSLYAETVIDQDTVEKISDGRKQLDKITDVFKQKFFYKSYRFIAFLSYFPWFVGALLFANAIVAYIGWWTAP